MGFAESKCPCRNHPKDGIIVTQLAVSLQPIAEGLWLWGISCAGDFFCSYRVSSQL